MGSRASAGLLENTYEPRTDVQTELTLKHCADAMSRAGYPTAATAITFVADTRSVLHKVQLLHYLRSATSSLKELSVNLGYQLGSSETPSPGGLFAVTQCTTKLRTPSPSLPQCPSTTSALRTSFRHRSGRSSRLVPSARR